MLLQVPRLGPLQQQLKLLTGRAELHGHLARPLDLSSSQLLSTCSCERLSDSEAQNISTIHNQEYAGTIYLQPQMT